MLPSYTSTRTASVRRWIVAATLLVLVVTGCYVLARTFYPLVGNVFLTNWSSSYGKQTNPFDGENFYVDPDSAAKKQQAAWRDTRPEDAAEIGEIASQPNVFFFSEWTRDKAGGT